MAQPPFKIDALQIEPGSGETLLIERDPITGSLKFTDNVIGGGLLLSQMVALHGISNVFVVGKSGAGSQYTTIQSALDEVPAGASPTNPYLILVFPGRYDETINIVRDGVSLIGIGQPEIRSALEATPNAVGNDHTLIISAQLGTIPQSCLIQGFRITNAHNNKAAIRVIGGANSTVAAGGQGVRITDCELWANAGGGNRPLWTTAVNTVILSNTSMRGNAASSVLVEETSSFQCLQSDVRVAMLLRYDTAQDEPSEGDNQYLISNCFDIASETALVPGLQFDGDGGGAFSMHGCSVSSQTVISGDQIAEFFGSTLEDLSILETVEVYLVNTTKTSLVAGNLNAVLNEPSNMGVAAFVASDVEAVVFDIPRGDANYSVSLELDSHSSNDETPWVTAKLPTGFTINFNTNQNLNVTWRIHQ